MLISFLPCLISVRGAVRTYGSTTAPVSTCLLYR
nr:MAG TPA: hypothetical protein [Caudoviricetes sp.]